MQTKDLNTRPVLELLKKASGPHESCGQHRGDYCHKGHWAMLFMFDDPSDMSSAFPPGTPYKLILSKMKSLLKKGLVDGCGCGCRGDFEITEKGLQWLTMNPE